MSDYRIVPTSRPELVAGYNRILDEVARERRWFGIVTGPPLEESARYVGEAIVHVVALDAGDEVVGWADIMRFPREGFRHGGRLGMGLVPRARGHGLGQALLARALGDARERGLERVELEVYGSNVAAIALYERLGFVRDGFKRGARKLDGRYDDNVLMTRWLVPEPPPAPETP